MTSRGPFRPKTFYDSMIYFTVFTTMLFAGIALHSGGSRQVSGSRQSDQQAI